VNGANISLANATDFKVGDVVTVVDRYKDISDAGSGPLTPGKTGKIVTVKASDPSKPYKVEADGSGGAWWYNKASLKMANPAPVAAVAGAKGNAVRQLHLTYNVCGGPPKMVLCSEGEPICLEASSAIVIKVNRDKTKASEKMISSAASGTSAPSHPLMLVQKLARLASSNLNPVMHRLLGSLRTVYARDMLMPWLGAMPATTIGSDLVNSLINILRLATGKRLRDTAEDKLAGALKLAAQTSSNVRMAVAQAAIKELAACSLIPKVIIETVESAHTYSTTSKDEGDVKIKGAVGLSVKFDPKCKTTSSSDVLKIIDQFGVSKSFSGNSDKWISMELIGSSLTWKFTATSGSSNKFYGFKFTVTALDDPAAESDVPDVKILELPSIVLCRHLLDIVSSSPPCDAETSGALASGLSVYATNESAADEDRVWALTQLAVLVEKGHVARPNIALLTEYLERRPEPGSCLPPHCKFLPLGTKPFEIGDQLRVKPGIKKPRYGWGTVKHGDVGVFRALRVESGVEKLVIDFRGKKEWKADRSEMEYAMDVYKGIGCGCEGASDCCSLCDVVCSSCAPSKLPHGSSFLGRAPRLPVPSAGSASGGGSAVAPGADVNYTPGQSAEVIILPGSAHAGNWVKCLIIGAGSSPSTFNIHVLPTTDFDSACGQADSDIDDVSAAHLRQIVADANPDEPEEVPILPMDEDEDGLPDVGAFDVAPAGEVLLAYDDFDSSSGGEDLMAEGDEGGDGNPLFDLPPRPELSDEEHMQVGQLTDMGFGEEQALYAYISAGKNLDAAIEKIFSGEVPDAPIYRPAGLVAPAPAPAPVAVDEAAAPAAPPAAAAAAPADPAAPIIAEGAPAGLAGPLSPESSAEQLQGWFDAAAGDVPAGRGVRASRASSVGGGPISRGNSAEGPEGNEPAPPGSVIRVSGSGNRRHTGGYIQSGVYNGHPEFWKVDAAGDRLVGPESSNIFWRVGGDGWGFHGSSASGVHAVYICPGVDSNLPPLDGWKLVPTASGADADTGGGATADARALPTLELLVHPDMIQLGEPVVATKGPSWEFEAWESASKKRGELIDNGRSIRGKGDWFWCSGPAVPEEGGEYFYEVKIDSIHDTADLYFGFGEAGKSTIGDESSVPGIYCYKSHKTPPSLYPSDTTLDEKTKAGDIIRVELDTTDTTAVTVTFRRNGVLVGTEPIPAAHATGRLAPYTTVYYQGAGITLLSAGVVGAARPWRFGSPKAVAQLTAAVDSRENVDDGADEGSSTLASAPTPNSCFEQLVRRLPVLLEAQYAHEQPLQGKSMSQSPYFGALCHLATELGMHECRFAAKSFEWLKLYDSTRQAAKSLLASTTPTESFIDQVKRLKLWKRWAPLIPEAWGPPDRVFDLAALAGPNARVGLEIDAQIVAWHENPIGPESLARWAGIPSDGKWKHGGIPDKTFVFETPKAGSSGSAWKCHFEAREWKNIEFGGGCVGRTLSKPETVGIKTPYFKPETESLPIVCAHCMLHYGTVQGSTEEATAAALAAQAVIVDDGTSSFGSLQHLPTPVLECRAAIFTCFIERGLLHPDLLPAFLSHRDGPALLSECSMLISGESKGTIIRKAIKDTMSNSDSGRPRLTLNRIGLVASANGLIGQHGIKSIFGQIMEQLEKKETEIESLWLRPKRLFKVDKLAGEGLEDAGGGYSEMISHIMTELAVGADDKSALPLLIRTPNGRGETGVNRDTLLFNPAATLPVHMRMFRFLGLWIGVAVRTDQPIILPLAGAMWDLLLGRAPTFAKPSTITDGGVGGVEDGAAASGGTVDLASHAVVGPQCVEYLRQASVFLSEIDLIAANELQRILSMPDELLHLEPQDTQFIGVTSKPFLALPPDEPVVTPTNRLEFVRRCCEVRCDEFSQQAAAVRAGIGEALPGPLLTLLTASQFENMVRLCCFLCFSPPCLNLLLFYTGRYFARAARASFEASACV
jgi:hypothetical protein